MTGATGVHLLLWSEDRAGLAARAGGGGRRRRRRPRARRADVGAALRAARTASRWSSTTRPATTASPATPTSPASTAAPCWPCPSSAAAPCGRCCCWRTGSSAARSPPSGSTPSSSSPASSPVSLDNAQLYAELTASRARIVAAADQARRRIERDLHDGAQQRLVASACRLRTAQASRAARSRRAGRAAGPPGHGGDQALGRAARARPRHPPGDPHRRRPAPGASSAGSPLPGPGRLDVRVDGPAARAGRDRRLLRRRRER